MRTTARHRREPGFTLIELLIVVAILTLLAAIALPNFFEARTRANVARAKSDLRTLSVAVESYYLDYMQFPPATDEKGEPIVPYPPVGLGPEAFETRLAPTLSTPVAYIDRLLEDPFHARGPDPEDPRIHEGPGYHYGSRDYARANNGVEGEQKFVQFVRMLHGQPDLARYSLGSHGPDANHDDDEDMTDSDAAVPYDPTNGTVSSGDIVRFGPSIGFGH